MRELELGRRVDSASSFLAGLRSRGIRIDAPELRSVEVKHRPDSRASQDLAPIRAFKVRPGGLRYRYEAASSLEGSRVPMCSIEGITNGEPRSGRYPVESAPATSRWQRSQRSWW